MTFKIKKIEPSLNFTLKVEFDDGKKVVYDVKDDMNTLPRYDDLRKIVGLFNQVKLDKSRTIVYWNDYIDLPSHALYEYGILQK